MQNIFQMKS